MTTQPTSEPTELTTALIAGLAIQANQLSEAAEDLRASYRFSRSLKVIIAIGFLMLTGLIVIALQNRSTGAATRQSTATIKDCTTPGGDCYLRSREATSDAVAQIVAAVNAHTNLVLIATLQCSRPHESNADLAACLEAKGVR